VKLLLAATSCCLALGLSAAPALAKPAVSFPAKLLRSSQVLGVNVYDSNGNQIGEINDVVFDENSGGMTRDILDINNYLSLNDQLTPLEWNKIETQKTDDGNYKFVVNASKPELKKENSFKKDHWPDLNKAWTQEMTKNRNVKLVRMSKTNDAKLFDTTGHEIGGIKDVMVDSHSGKVAYAVVYLQQRLH
jgi:sporulation protein YlmC with PRC-barrel domain